MLTHEFLEGRRVRYISPLRLYLVASLVYFLIAAAAPNLQLRPGTTSVGGITFGVTTSSTKGKSSAPQRVAEATDKAIEGQQGLTGEQKAAALADIARAPKVLQPVLRRGVEDPKGLKRGLLETMPRTLFALLPVFAGIVALFYRGRKYPEHLYFAIHLHAFIFLALAMTELLKFTHIAAIAAAGGLAGGIWVPVYATLAFRRVYGGSLARTIGKEIGIGAIYLVVTGVALTLMVYWVSIAT
jgi:hypothetical protein